MKLLATTLNGQMMLRYLCDSKRHLICVPYSIPNLHIMANAYGWTTPDARIHYLDGSKKDIYSLKVDA